MPKSHPVAAVLLAACFANPAAAFILGGSICGGSLEGAFVKLTPSAELRVGQDTFQDGNLYAFDESQNILIEAEIAVEIGPRGRVIPAGSVVASHYIFFDPAFGAIQRGYVDFDAPVLGVAASQRTMSATDYLADTEVEYLNPGLRGLEWDDQVWIDPALPNRVHMSWTASTPGDYIRVFTAQSPGV